VNLWFLVNKVCREMSCSERFAENCRRKRFAASFLVGEFLPVNCFSVNLIQDGFFDGEMSPMCITRCLFCDKLEKKNAMNCLWIVGGLCLVNCCWCIFSVI
jgi:hypothetical protein